LATTLDYNRHMKTAPAHVVRDGGSVEVESRLPRDTSGWVVDAASKKKLLKSLAHARRGEVFDADDVLAET
jgi:hypothetical protein